MNDLRTARPVPDPTRSGKGEEARLVRDLDLDEMRALEIAGEPEDEPRVVVPTQARRGRGATLNPPVRFERQSANPFDDGWDTIGSDVLDEIGLLPPLPTTLTRDASRSVISWNTSPDLGFDRAVNPYRGCEHGCVYCFARPTHAYLGYSPGLDFETRLLFKPDVAELLEKELSKPGYVARPMALGTNTDPYQPVERGLKLTRAVLEVLERFGHPVSIVTKSAGVLRDLDILGRLAQRNLVRVYVSVTTLDPVLARRMEPRAATPERRLQALASLTQARVPAGVLAAPMIPGLNDAELEKILEAASRAGADHAGYVLLRLPHELRELFEDWLAHNYPERARHVLNLIRDTRSGSLNDPRFHNRFVGGGAYADLLAKRFARAARKWGFTTKRALDCTVFAVPPRVAPTSERAQLSLF
jgi:DNA repair photolyase